MRLTRLNAILAVPLLLGLGAADALAQGPGSIEAGAFARLTAYSDVIDDGSGVGGGLRVGYFLSPIMSVELDGAYGSADGGNLSHIPAHLRALLNLPFTEKLSFFLGTGVAVDHYGDAADLTSIGIGTTAGARFGITRTVALRVNGVWDWLVAPADPLPKYGNLGLEAGLSFFPGGTGAVDPSADSDGDGVLNRSDACPGSPAGAAVDATGCPQRGGDADGDGVSDINDICPGTPAEAKVDENGCAEGG